MRCVHLYSENKRVLSRRLKLSVISIGSCRSSLSEFQATTNARRPYKLRLSRHNDVMTPHELIWWHQTPFLCNLAINQPAAKTQTVSISISIYSYIKRWQNATKKHSLTEIMTRRWKYKSHKSSICIFVQHSNKNSESLIWVDFLVNCLSCCWERRL